MGVAVTGVGVVGTGVGVTGIGVGMLLLVSFGVGVLVMFGLGVADGVAPPFSNMSGSTEFPSTILPGFSL